MSDPGEFEPQEALIRSAIWHPFEPEVVVDQVCLLCRGTFSCFLDNPLLGNSFYDGCAVECSSQRCPKSVEK